MQEHKNDMIWWVKKESNKNAIHFEINENVSVKQLYVHHLLYD